MLLYSLRITGTEDGGKAPSSVIIFWIYSGGVKSYNIFKIFKLGYCFQFDRSILGSPIANNLSTLKDIRVNVIQPSENLIGNILPTLEDAELLFPQLNFLHNCGCSVCEDILNRIKGDSNLFDETIKVSTLLIIGQELDIIQSKCGYKSDNASYINKYSRFIRKNTYSPNGYLFDRSFLTPFWIMYVNIYIIRYK